MRGRICDAIHQYAEAITEYMKYYDKNEEFLCLKYWNVNKSYGWAMSQKLSANHLKVG